MKLLEITNSCIIVCFFDPDKAALFLMLICTYFMPDYAVCVIILTFLFIAFRALSLSDSLTNSFLEIFKIAKVRCIFYYSCACISLTTFQLSDCVLKFLIVLGMVWTKNMQDESFSKHITFNVKK